MRDIHTKKYSIHCANNDASFECSFSDASKSSVEFVFAHNFVKPAKRCHSNLKSCLDYKRLFDVASPILLFSVCLCAVFFRSLKKLNGLAYKTTTIRWHIHSPDNYSWHVQSIRSRTTYLLNEFISKINTIFMSKVLIN